MSANTVPYTKRQLVNLIKRFLNNNFPSDSFSLSQNEIMLHIDQCVADKIPKLAYQNAQFEGVLAVPEAFLITFKLVVTNQDPVTNDWFVTLPQPPLSLPLGYSITDAYFADPLLGRSQKIWLIKAKRRSRRNDMPFPPGVSGWVENNIFWLKANNNQPLLNANVRVQMPVARTQDLDTPYNMPDDIIWEVYNETVQRLMQRFGVPRDNVKDDQPAGNTVQKS